MTKGELEKENARLTTNEKSLLAERKIIVKENAELKKRLEILNLNGNIAIRDLNDQLTKAKEIIKGLLIVFPYDMPEEELDSGDKDMVEKAEEFLKEVEK